MQTLISCVFPRRTDKLVLLGEEARIACIYWLVHPGTEVRAFTPVLPSLLAQTVLVTPSNRTQELG